MVDVSRLFQPADGPFWLAPFARSINRALNRKAGKSADETIAGQWTFDANVVFNSLIELNRSNPIMDWVENDRTDDEQKWRMKAAGGDFRWETRQGTGGLGEVAFEIERSGYEISSVNFFGDALTFNGSAVVIDSNLAAPAPTAPTLLNSWVNFGGAAKDAGYRKTPDGMVHLEGLVKDGTDQHILTLPSGYRPSETVYFAAACSTGYCRAFIDSSGLVQVTGYSATWTSLSGLSFFAD